jgi:hypothetical protein
LILALDTDVLVSWAMAGSPRHGAARRLFEAEVRGRSGSLALTTFNPDDFAIFGFLDLVSAADEPSS